MRRTKSLAVLAATVLVGAAFAVWWMTDRRGRASTAGVRDDRSIQVPNPDGAGLSASDAAGRSTPDRGPESPAKPLERAVRSAESMHEANCAIQVLDETGYPVPDAEVWVIPDRKITIPEVTELDPGAMRSSFAELSGESSEDGTLDWSLPTRSGSSLIVARRAGWHSGYAWIDPGVTHSTSVSVRLLRHSDVHGRVVDAVASAPVSGAILVAIPRFRPESGSTSQRMELDRYLLGERCTSSADGTFSFDTLRDESHDLWCFAAGREVIHVELDRPVGQSLEIRFGETIRVSGYILDEDGAAVSGANVRAERCGALPVVSTDVAHTDSEGRFYLASVPPGPALIRVDKRGYGSVKPYFDLKADAPPIEITLGPDAELAGHVIDAGGQPIAGANVTVRDMTLGTTLGDMDSRPDGSWLMYWVPPKDRIDLEVYKEGYDVLWLSSVEHPSKDLSITLTKLTSLSFILQDEDHSPIQDFTVAVVLGGTQPSEERETRIRQPIHAAHSSDGQFKITGIQSGFHELTFCADGFVPKIVNDLTTRPGQSLGPIHVILSRGLEIRGRVVDDAGHPIPNAEMLEPSSAFSGEIFASEHRSVVKTGGDGVFTLQGVTSHVSLVVMAPGRGSTLFSDLRADEFPRDLTICSPGSIDGQVVSPWQSPETCIRIRACLDRTWIGEEVHPDAAGRFRFAALSPGRYRLDVIDDWQRQEMTSDSTISRWVDVRSGETSSIDLLAQGDGRLEGRVTGDASFGRQRLQILIFRGEEQRGTPEACVNVDENGCFHANQLAPGPCRLLLTSSWAGFACASEQSATIHSDGAPTHVEFHLDKSSAGGRVVDARGAPVDAIATLLADPSGNAITSARTDMTGSFRILGLPPGSVRIEATASGFADAFSDPLDFTAIEPPNVELRLESESRLLVTARDDVGRPVPGATVDLYVFAYPEPFRRSSSPTDAGGRLTFTRLPSGRVQLSARARDHVPVGPIDSTLARAEDRRVDVVLTRTGSLVVRCIDAKGNPVSRAPIALSLETPAGHEPPREESSDATGRARFEALRPGHYQIRHGDIEATEGDIEPGATRTVEFTISP
jgi:carboxypeptidase family protein